MEPEVKEEPIPGEEPSKKIKTDETELDQLKKHSIVVADTGQFALIEKYSPQDSTTNPSLILQAAKAEGSATFFEEAVQFAIKNFERFSGAKKSRKSAKKI